MSDRSTTSAATGRDIIFEIVRNMREGLEPLHYSTLAPSVYHVYLHPSDLERLRALVPQLVKETKQALDEEVLALNKTSLFDRLGSRGKNQSKVKAPDQGWQIEIHENTDDDVEPGDILIHSELAIPPRPELGAGSLTRRIATGRIRGADTETRRLDVPAASAGDIYAIIRFEDNRGPQVFEIRKNQIVIGRGGQAYWTDLRLETLPDVSREHLRLRRDPTTGNFFLKDVSRLGTTIDGKSVPSSIEYVGGEKRDKNIEAPVPRNARIGLAGVVFLDFKANQ